MRHQPAQLEALLAQARSHVLDGARELRQGALPAGAAAVAGHLEDDGAQALRRQRLRQRQHLARVPAPAVNQQDDRPVRCHGLRIHGEACAFERPGFDAP
jgi:hypothetical protein